jgi:hypothetical protein
VASKVARLIEEYGLDGLGAELETRWTGDGVERSSLRELADEFNERLLTARLREAGLATAPEDVDRLYHNLTDDDVSAGVRRDARGRLERDGIDVDTLESDFVTYQAIRSYLKRVRGAEYEGVDDAEKLRKDREAIGRLTTRLGSGTESRLDSLRETGRLDLGEFEVLVDVQVLCEECGRQHAVDDLFDRGGCVCRPGE